MALSTNIARTLLLRTGSLPCKREILKNTPRITQKCFTQRNLPITCQCGFSTTQPSLSPRHKITTQRFSTSPAIQYADNEEISDTLQKVAERVAAPDVGRLFAVLHFGGAQRKVTEEDIVVMRTHTEADVGEVIRFNKVLLVGGTDFTIVGRPVLSPSMVRVEGRVIEKTLGQTKIYYMYRARQNDSRMHLFKGLLTMVRITKIDILPLQQ